MRKIYKNYHFTLMKLYAKYTHSHCYFLYLIVHIFEYYYIPTLFKIPVDKLIIILNFTVIISFNHY